MNENRKKHCAALAATVIKGLESRNMSACYAETCEDAVKAALAMIPEGSTVTMDATSFTSLPANTAAALMARPDVTFVFTYMLNGVRYTVTIPAGTNIAALLNSSGGIDFASLASFTAAG